MCTGWDCSIQGVVYASSAGPGNELGGVTVHLLHTSNCSPTRGEHETVTGADGTFSFPIYLHDTDSFRIEVAVQGYEPASELFGGFDCLYCNCPPLELVLQTES